MPARDKKNWFTVSAKKNDSVEMMIYDVIGAWGVSADTFVAALNSIDAATINVHINSPGGDAFGGMAMYNAMKAHKSHINVSVDGMAASAASIVAIGGNTVTICKNALFMIHNPYDYAFGNADELEKHAAFLRKLQTSLARTYADETGNSAESCQTAMDEETWYDAQESLAFGLVDSIRNDDEEDVDDDPEMMLRSSLALKAIAGYRKTPERLRSVAAKLAAGIEEEEDIVMPTLTATVRDGKSFVNIGGVEYEISVQAGAQAATAPDATVIAAAQTKGRDDERLYRKEWDTALASAKITGEQAVKFEASFYGRPIDDVKFLASNAIGARATPVGETTGAEGAGAGENKDEKALNEFKALAGKRFDENADVRRLMGVKNADRANPMYVQARERYIKHEVAYKGSPTKEVERQQR